MLATAGGFGLMAVTGCQVSDPRIVGGPAIPPAEAPPSPEPVLPGIEAGLRHEADLAALTGQLSKAAASLRLTPALSALVTALNQAHQDHLDMLVTPHPEQRGPSATATPRGSTARPTPTSTATLASTGDREGAIRSLTNKYAQAVGDYRTSATGSSGPAALLWGSLAAYTQAASVALSSDVARPDPPPTGTRPLAPWSDGEAMQQVVRQLQALIYGYQATLAPLNRPDLQVATDLLAGRRFLLAQLSATLRERGLAVPAADPVYVLPVTPVDRPSAAQLIWKMESAFVAFVGPWLAAAADEPTRRLALGELEKTARVSLQWGGPLPVWPGWPA